MVCYYTRSWTGGHPVQNRNYQTACDFYPSLIKRLITQRGTDYWGYVITGSPRAYSPLTTTVITGRRSDGHARSLDG
jgi:hypothetical protein